MDLCLRITIAPIYFLPAPSFLIKFYREHFQKFRSGGRSGSGGNGSSRNNYNNPTSNNSNNFGSGNNHNIGSFTDSEIGQGRGGSTGSGLHSYLYGSAKTTRAGSRLGHGGDFCVNNNNFAGRDSFGDEIEEDDLRLDRSPQHHSHHHHTLSSNNNNNNRVTSPTNVGSAFKLFQSRDRGQSVESSRGLSRDFEYDESSQSQSQNGGHSHSNSVDIFNMQPLRRSTPLEDPDIGLHLDGPKALAFGVLDSPQVPKAVLSSRYLRAPIDHANATRPDSEFMPRSPTRSEKEQEQDREPQKKVEDTTTHHGK